MDNKSFNLPVFILIAVGTILSCGNPFAHQSKTGSLHVTIPGASSGARDILPAALSLGELLYDAHLARVGFSSISVVGQAYNGIQFSGIALGTWSLTVTGKLGSAAVFGTTVDITIAEGQNTIPVTLDPLQVGTGSLAVGLSWPDGLIDDVNVYWTEDIGDVVAISNTKPSSKLWVNGVDYTFTVVSPALSINKSGIPSGSYYLIVELMRGGSVAASVIERVRVFDNRESAKSIVVANTEISKPPIAPSGLGVLSRTAESIVFGWTDNSNTETDFEFWNGSSWITGIVAGTTQYSVLASSVSTTVNTTFSVRAVNSFGSTANSDYVFIPVTFDANGATEGSVPTAQTKIPDSTLTLAANTGNLARTGYTFAGWNTASGGTGTDYAVSSSYTANVAVILYAKWVANTASLTLSLANPLEPAVTFSGGTLSINRAVNGSITVTVSDGSYTYYQWTIAGQGPVPVLGTNGGESITIATQSGTTNLATFTVTLFFGNGSPDHSKSFSIQVVEE